MFNVTRAAATNERKNADVRWLTHRRDLPQVLDIEKESFIAPWNEDDFLKHLNQRSCIGMVMEEQGTERIIGFFVYELKKDHLCLLNIAIHPAYRGQGYGGQAMQKLQSKLNSTSRRYIMALMPESCLPSEGFFTKYNVTLRPTVIKGEATYTPGFYSMTARDFEEVQAMENEVLLNHGRKPQNIGDLIAKGSRYGIIARDQWSNALMGYVLYERDSKGISLNGEFGIIVGRAFRKRGIGRALMQELVKQNLPINFYDVCLTCHTQVGFLRAIGVPVPKLQRLVNVEWRPGKAKL